MKGEHDPSTWRSAFRPEPLEGPRSDPYGVFTIRPEVETRFDGDWIHETMGSATRSDVGGATRSDEECEG